MCKHISQTISRPLPFVETNDSKPYANLSTTGNEEVNVVTNLNYIHCVFEFGDPIISKTNINAYELHRVSIEDMAV